MKYKCIKEMLIEKVDGDGFFLEKYGRVKIGSIWEINNSSNIIGGEIHLENCNENGCGFGWIEICKDSLKEYFKLI
jgi:hypothetical protein